MRHSQEEKCGRYEKDAGHIVDEMIRQDAGVGADNVCSMFFGALVLFFVYYVDCYSLFFFGYRLEWNLLVSMELEMMELVRYKYSCHVCSAMLPFFFELTFVWFPYFSCVLLCCGVCTACA